MNNQLSAINLSLALVLQSMMDTNPSYQPHDQDTNIADVMAMLWGRYSASARVPRLHTFLTELRKQAPQTANRIAVNLCTQNNDNEDEDWFVHLYAFGFLLQSQQMGVLKSTDHYLFESYGNDFNHVEFQKKLSGITQAEVPGSHTRESFVEGELHREFDLPEDIVILLEKWYHDVFDEQLKTSK